MSEVPASVKGKFLIGGGYVTQALFDQALELSGHEKPQLLFDLGASANEAQFSQGMELVDHLRSMLRANIAVLQDSFDSVPTQMQLDDRIGDASVICVGGGSTAQLMTGWQTQGITNRLRARINAHELVASGSSAGALCWFDTGFSDSEQYRVPEGAHWDYENVLGASAITGWATVHYSDTDALQRERASLFQKNLETYSGEWQTAVGMESLSALRIVDDLVTIADISSEENDKNVYLFNPSATYQPQLLRPGDAIPMAFAS